LRFGPNILSTLFLFGLVFPSSPRYLNGSKLGRFFRGDVCGRDKFTKFEHRFQARLLTAATRQIENVLVMIPTFLGTVFNWVCLGGARVWGILTLVSGMHRKNKVVLGPDKMHSITVSGFEE
jgi:hypothetical protein